MARRYKVEASDPCPMETAYEESPLLQADLRFARRRTWTVSLSPEELDVNTPLVPN